MPATTSKGAPYPLEGDPHDVPADLYALAQWVTARPGVATMTTAERDALAGEQLWDGRLIFNATTRRHEGYEADVETWRAMVALEEPNTWTEPQTFADVEVTGTLDVDQLAGNAGAALDGKAENTRGGSEKALTSPTTTGTVTLNAANASVFTVNPTANITLAISNPAPTGRACTLTVIINQPSTVRSVTMPSGAVWIGPAPTHAANKRTVLTMMTTDAGATWLCSGGVQV